MMLNEKIKPIKKKTSKLKITIASLPFAILGLGYAVMPRYDLSNNPPFEDNFMISKIAQKNNLFNHSNKSLQSISCSTNLDNKRFCLLTIVNPKTSSPNSLLLVGRDNNELNVNMDPNNLNKSPHELSLTTEINGKKINLPDYNLDFVKKEIHISSLDKTKYTPNEVYEAMVKEESSMSDLIFNKN